MSSNAQERIELRVAVRGLTHQFRTALNLRAFEITEVADGPLLTPMRFIVRSMNVNRLGLRNFTCHFDLTRVQPRHSRLVQMAMWPVSRKASRDGWQHKPWVRLKQRGDGTGWVGNWDYNHGGAPPVSLVLDEIVKMLRFSNEMGLRLWLWKMDQTTIAHTR